jgi:hypothetical protein
MQFDDRDDFADEVAEDAFLDPYREMVVEL